MIEIATCSYSQYKPEMGLPVRTSVGPSKWPRFDFIPHWTNVTPLPYTLRLPKPRYEEIYMKMLDDHGLEVLTEDLEWIQDSWYEEYPDSPIHPRLVFMCFENLGTPGKWCHRQMFATWWETHTGQEVRELGAHPPHDAPVTPEPEQLAIL